jgi:hypothetical protein
MSAENNETGGSLADRITKPDEASQPTTTTGTSSNPQSLRILYNLHDSFSRKHSPLGTWQLVPFHESRGITPQ